MRSPAPDPQLPTDRDGAPAAPGFLDRTLTFDVVWWAAIGWTVVLAAAIALRFAKLGEWALSPDEARRAYDAWILFRGQPAPSGEALAATEPLFLLLQGIAFFVFGATDAIARIPAALCGFGIVALTPLLRRWIGAPAALGMAALAAISPTLVYASRVADPETLVAFLALLLVVAIFRAGIEGAPAGNIRRWAVVAGFALAGLLAASPSAITVLIALVVAFAIASRDPGGAPRLGVRALVVT
ncbi:MAG TPA: glycosyltransferase family 39 protein, partial [Thermomicrobiales bacterium]|nr:glycosyltransferase family 39 protein [Thermomicrobiales bacterium]